MFFLCGLCREPREIGLLIRHFIGKAKAGNVNPQVPARTLPGLPQVKLRAAYDIITSSFILTEQMV